MKPMSILGAAIAAMVVWAGTAAAAPNASVPSIGRVGQETVVHGDGFASGALLSVRVTGPSGAVALAAVIAGADGKVAHSLTPTAAGRYRVELLQADARVADLVFMAAPK
jgi:hypothetical protein